MKPLCKGNFKALNSSDRKIYFYENISNGHFFLCFALNFFAIFTDIFYISILFLFFFGAVGCSDSHSSCKTWANAGYCRHTYVDYMKKNCKKSCNLCSGKPFKCTNNGLLSFIVSYSSVQYVSVQCSIAMQGNAVEYSTLNNAKLFSCVEYNAGWFLSVQYRQKQSAKLSPLA